MKKLEPPLTYQGGKSRISSQIWDIIESRNNISGQEFYDLCCGSGAITLEAINRDLSFSKFKMLDYSVWGDFWKSIGDGSFLFDIFEMYLEKIPTKKEDIQGYLQDLSRKNPFDGVNISHVYIYLLLQAGSFGGKQIWLDGNTWKNNSFRSYWMPTETSSRRSPVNPMMPMPETLLDRIKNLYYNLHMVVEGKNKNIENVTQFPSGSIIYVDPPYKKTTGYKNSFDILEWVSKVKSKCDVKIYVSEQISLGEKSFLISGKRSKGSISGGAEGVQEWLTEF